MDFTKERASFEYVVTRNKSPKCSLTDRSDRDQTEGREHHRFMKQSEQRKEMEIAILTAHFLLSIDSVPGKILNVLLVNSFREKLEMYLEKL